MFRKFLIDINGKIYQYNQSPLYINYNQDHNQRYQSTNSSLTLISEFVTIFDPHSGLELNTPYIDIPIYSIFFIDEYNSLQSNRFIIISQEYSTKINILSNTSVFSKSRIFNCLLQNLD
ncbi:hypothetical protein V6O07_22645 [Arthrospira platensis SPKY2]